GGRRFAASPPNRRGGKVPPRHIMSVPPSYWSAVTMDAVPGRRPVSIAGHDVQWRTTMIAELPEALVSWAAPIVKDIIEQHRAAYGGVMPTDDEIIRTFKSNLPKYLGLGSHEHSHKNSPDYALIVDLP